MVELRQPGADSLRLTSEDRPHGLDRGFMKWRIPVPAHATAQVRYAYSATASVYAARPVR